MSFSLSLREYQNLSPQQWVLRASQTMPRIAVVVLIAAIAWQLVQLTWLLLGRTDDSAAATIGSAPMPAFNNPRQPINVQAIASAHLFGTARAEAPDPANAPQTQMNLVLAGTWALEDPAQGYAFVGESANAARMYAVGKVVRGGTTLRAVYPDRVVLDTGGRLETLTLPRLSAGTGGTQGRAAAPASVRPQPNPFADNLRRVAQSNPAAFTEIVRPQPVFANGVQRGYRVYPGRQREQFSKLGLQPGDLVLSINGTPLDDPQRGLEIFNTLADSDRVSITVERNGKTQALSLNTAQIHLPDGAPAPAYGGRLSAPLPGPQTNPSDSGPDTD